MVYLRVKEQYDQKRKGRDDIYIGGELYTPREVERKQLNVHYLEPVVLSKRNVYRFFGARFQVK